MIGALPVSSCSFQRPKKPLTLSIKIAHNSAFGPEALKCESFEGKGKTAPQSETTEP